MGISSLGYYFNIFFSWKIFPNSKTAYNESQLRIDYRGVLKHQITPKKGIHRESFQFQLIVDERRLLTKSR